MNSNAPLYQMYSQRENFVIVALTGITGSGCSDFADVMSMTWEKWLEKGLIRTPDELKNFLPAAKHSEVFWHEYRRCFEFSKNYKPFQIIRYKNVLILYVLCNLMKKYSNGDEIFDAFSELLSYKFHHSYKHQERFPYDDVDTTFTPDILKEWGMDNEILGEVESIVASEQDEKSKNEARKLLSSLFFGNKFNDFCSELYRELKKRDYYSKNFFVHRLAAAIRATGNAESKYDDFKDSHTSNHVFEVVELINRIIKGYHLNYPDKPRRFVIDSIRNSMEILYLRERYNAFYMVAIHNDGQEQKLLERKVSRYAEGEKLHQICGNIADLNKIEKEIKAFEQGHFFAPDLSRCVSESELHIAFHTHDDLRIERENYEQRNKESNHEDLGFSLCSFYTYAEQWMKYSSLISRPGIVTPTCDERCMSIAYVAKFNSGCISRQVGCTIVDKENAIQSVGWNDPPSPQLPCNLRDVKDLLSMKEAVENSGNKDDESLYQVYSKFELTDDRDYPIKDNDGNVVDSHGKGFCDCLDKETKEKVKLALSAEGLHYPYCFRSRYNTYINNKDAVNTRSLHAEENTMLRLARQGGVGLNGGTMYVTASPCVLCSKKAYQIGIKEIVYLDPYTDIAPDLILSCGYDQPKLRPFMGAIGGTFYKLYQPFMPYKDEITIWEKTSGGEG